MMEQLQELAALLTIFEKASALGEPFKNIRDAAFRKLAELEKSAAEQNAKAKEAEAKKEAEAQAAKAKAEKEHDEAPKSGKGRY